jgi:hypothetical protein
LRKISKAEKMIIEKCGSNFKKNVGEISLEQVGEYTCLAPG